MCCEVKEGFDQKKNGVAYGTIALNEYDSKTTGATRQCYIYTPPDYDECRTYPVLYLLHGIGGTHAEWLAGAPNEILSNLIACGEANSMIVVMPNIRAMKNDAVPPDILGEVNINAFDHFIYDLRNDLMPFITGRYRVSDRRSGRAIAGLSMGGREALYIGFSMPEVFGYIGAFSPAPGLIPFPSLRYPGQLFADQVVLPDAYREHTSMLICSGNQDNVVGNVPYEYHQVLERNKVRHTYYTVDGGHDFSVWKNGLYNFAKSIFRDR